MRESKFEHKNCRCYCAVTVAAVATVASAGVAAYSASSKASADKDALNYQKNNTPTLHSYDPVLATYDPNGGQRQFFSAYDDFGKQAQGAASGLNNYYMQSLNALAPIGGGIRIAGENALQNLRGQLPKDSAQQIARNAAQAGIQGGFGPDSGITRNLTARDYGLTSLNLQNTGLQQLGDVQRLATAATPYTAGQYLGTPDSYNARFDQYNLTNTGRQNQAAMDAAGVSNQNQLAQYQSGLAGVQASNINPLASAAVSGLGSAASYYTHNNAYGLSGNNGTATPASFDNTYNATQNGVYNPYLDQGNYSLGGNFYGNPYSYG